MQYIQIRAACIKHFVQIIGINDIIGANLGGFQEVQHLATAFNWPPQSCVIDIYHILLPNFGNLYVESSPFQPHFSNL